MVNSGVAFEFVAPASAGSETSRLPAEAGATNPEARAAESIKAEAESEGGVVPAGAVFEERVAFPDAGGFGEPDRAKVAGCTAPRPVGPPGYVAVTHGIVMHVVQGGPKMRVGTDRAIGGAEKT